MAALLEGESLFNDASAIVLFDIFLQARSVPACAVRLPCACLNCLRGISTA